MFGLWAAAVAELIRHLTSTKKVKDLTCLDTVKTDVDKIINVL
jgi:hypothetical protein